MRDLRPGSRPSADRRDLGTVQGAAVEPRPTNKTSTPLNNLSIPFCYTPERKMRELVLTAPELSQLGGSERRRFDEDLEYLSKAVNELSEILFAAADWAVEKMATDPFDSIVGDEPSGRFLARFIHQVLAAHGHDLSHISLVPPGIAGHLKFPITFRRELREKGTGMGKKPLIVTEFIEKGRYLKAICSTLSTLGIYPSVLSTFGTDKAAITMKKLSCRKFFIAEHVDLDSDGEPKGREHLLNRNPILNGRVKKLNLSALDGTDRVFLWPELPENRIETREHSPQVRTWLMEFTEDALTQLVQAYCSGSDSDDSYSPFIVRSPSIPKGSYGENLGRSFRCVVRMKMRTSIPYP